MDELKTDNKLETKTDKPLREIVRLRINARVLKNVLSLLATVTTELKIVFDKDKASIKTVDPSHVEMISAELKKELFIEYDVRTDIPESNGSVTLGVDIGKLLLILKTVKKEDSFNMEYDTLTDPCSIKVNIGLFEHKVNIICIDGLPDPKMPVMDFKAMFTINTSDLKDFLTQAEAVSDHFSIKTTEDKVYLNAEGDVNKIELCPLVSNLTSRSTHKSLFSNDYFIKAVSRIKNLFSFVDIHIADDYPVKIEGNMFKAVGSYAYITVNILIAPRIESE